MEETRAYELVDGLHELADFIKDKHLMLPEDITFEITSWLYAGYQLSTHEAVRQELALVTRAALSAKAAVIKEYTSYAFELHLCFGPLTWVVSSRRDAVCTAEVVGQETYEVEEEVGEDLRPTVTVTKTKDIIKWNCDPVLERLTDKAASA